MSYVTKEQVERAKQLDLLTYLQCFEPYELVRCSRNAYTTRTHDSLKISNGKWFWWSRNIGGRSALDYLIKVRGMPFPDAVLLIEEQVGNTSPVATSAKERDEPRPFMLPEPNDNHRRVVAYLKGRGIHQTIIDFCLKTGRLYESRQYHNAVFVGLEPHGIPRYAMLRGTAGIRYMGEAIGSDKRYSFSIPSQGESSVLHLFESAIDLLSYCTLEWLVCRNWRQDHLLSLAGVYRPLAIKEEGTLPIALVQYVQDHAQVKHLVLHLDNDEPGRFAAQAIQILLSPTLLISHELPQHGKDVNDELKWRMRKFELSR